MINQAVNNSIPTSTVQVTNSSPMEIWITVGVAIWIIGMIILLLYSVLTTIKLSNKLRTSKPIFDNVYEMKGIKTPFVFGIAKPKIYLPANISEAERSYIIKHEETHIKRLDHIIKPFGFLVLCIHWFNPLVWIAFFLMSEDMELSCDESVIKQMGSGIKKEYSTSLLALSTGRRIVGGCPLAFGESNTKGRIKNILNYKRPAFWGIIVAVVVVAIVSLGLMSDPRKQPLTVEDYANQFVEEQIKGYENYFSITDSKIIKMEKLSTLNNLLPYHIEVWSIEYRLKPEGIDKALMAGNIGIVDGWVTEDTSMGRPMLIFSYKKSNPEYLGSIWTSDRYYNTLDYSSIAEHETAVRAFLEKKKLIPAETYSGNHILVQFPLSTGETSQLFLSQPVVQGESGIWCVERWMDGTGNIYYDTPETSGTAIDYYNDLQNQANAGQNLSNLDPLQVALDYINNTLGQKVSIDKLNPIYSATAEDFAKIPESHFIGFISNFDKDNYSFHLDQIEWLTAVNDAKRLRELNIDPDGLPNGFYIHNPHSYPMHSQITDETKYFIIDRTGNAEHKSVTMEEFIKYLGQFSDFTPPFRIVMKGGYVQSITEQYVP